MIPLALGGGALLGGGVVVAGGGGYLYSGSASSAELTLCDPSRDG